MSQAVRKHTVPAEGFAKAPDARAPMPRGFEHEGSIGGSERYVRYLRHLTLELFVGPATQSPRFVLRATRHGATAASTSICNSWDELYAQIARAKKRGNSARAST